MARSTRLANLVLILMITAPVSSYAQDGDDAFTDHAARQIACAYPPDPTAMLLYLNKTKQVDLKKGERVDSETCWSLRPSLTIDGVSSPMSAPRPRILFSSNSSRASTTAAPAHRPAPASGSSPMRSALLSMNGSSESLSALWPKRTPGSPSAPLPSAKASRKSPATAQASWATEPLRRSTGLSESCSPRILRPDRSPAV